MIVYGSTPVGFCAAIAAAREGAKVNLFEPTEHIGGISTGGRSRLSPAGCPEWPDDIDLCTDALSMRLTGQRPEEVFPALANLIVHA